MNTTEPACAPRGSRRSATPNDGELFDVCSSRVPDAALRRRILVEHPAKLYAFEA